MKTRPVLCMTIASGLLLSSFAVSAGTFGAESLAGPEVRAPLNEPGIAVEDLTRMAIPDLIRLEMAADLAAAQSELADAEYDYAELTSMTAEALFHIDVSASDAVPTPLPGAAWLTLSGLAGLMTVARRARASRHTSV